jgi:hypothetical protein
VTAGRRRTGEGARHGQHDHPLDAGVGRRSRGRGGRELRPDLIDEYRVFIHPVLLGGGEPLFPTSEARRNLRLVDARPFDDASIFVRWMRKDA